MARVSPTARPGSRPADDGSRTRCAELLSPSRRAPAARCTASGSPTAVGGPRAERTATTSSPRCGRETAARTRTGCPGSTRAHSSAAPKKTTSARNRCLVAPSTRRVTVASATTRGGPAPRSTCGSPSNSSTTDAVRSAWATECRGEPSLAATLTAPVADATATPARTVRRTAAIGPRRRPTTAARTQAASASRPSRAGDVTGASTVVSHTAAATGTSRRSTQLQRACGPLTPSPVRPAPPRSPDRCPVRRRAPRRSGRGPRGCDARRSAEPGRARCPAGHPVPPRRPC